MDKHIQFCKAQVDISETGLRYSGSVWNFFLGQPNPCLNNNEFWPVTFGQFFDLFCVCIDDGVRLWAGASERVQFGRGPRNSSLMHITFSVVIIFWYSCYAMNSCYTGIVEIMQTLLLPFIHQLGLEITTQDHPYLHSRSCFVCNRTRVYG